MKSKMLMIYFGAVAAMTAGAALAGGSEVVSRSQADMEADLMRTYQSPGGPSAGGIGTRSQASNYSDLMRDWDGKLAENLGTIVGTASTDPTILKGGTKTLQDLAFARH